MSPADRPRVFVLVDDRRRELWDAVRPHLAPQFTLVLPERTPGGPGAAALPAEAVDALADGSAGAVLATGDAAVPAYRAVAGARYPPRLVLLDPGSPTVWPESGARVALSVVGRTDGTPRGATALLAWRHHGTAEFGAHTLPPTIGPRTGALCRDHILAGLRLWWLDGA
ncbi:hypothetical protein [Streptomyces sp. ME19-01-6]|uniref:hypothetical protein n=1 Tax=Streptomyces sp. ME19-01-6 TaxID=3028686 RepID=UPI0029B95D76|nr:hypothetical protein [Streptomyces sp. ME19-01-6]MDX3225358.1 hypothetical protein [Streptomyces sp. ME19-01-6]